MKTQMLSAQRPEDIAAAAGLLRNGKLVAIPTETVYGLGANGLDENAVLRIFEAKGRPQDNPLILHISEPKELESICHDIPAQAWLLAEHFWPGPLTMVLPVRDLVPKRTTAGLDTVAVRCPKTAATRELIRLAGVPIAAPSANRSGKPSTTTAAHVLHDMDGRIEAILDGGPCEVGVESTIVDLTGERPRLLRPGGVTPEELRALLGELDIDCAVLGQISNDAVVRAPGMKYKHYSPKAKVVILDGDLDSFVNYVESRKCEGEFALCFEGEEKRLTIPTVSFGKMDRDESQAAVLFDALRELDKKGCRLCYARMPRKSGVGLAVYNRLIRAAAFEVIKL